MPKRPPSREVRRFALRMTKDVKQDFEEGNAQGRRTIATEEYEVQVEVTIDWDAICHEMATAAFHNKGQRSKDGPIVVEVADSKLLRTTPIANFNLEIA